MTVFEDLDTDRGPFMDTAAAMRNLDLVITSDTAIPHLAGALDVDVSFTPATNTLPIRRLGLAIQWLSFAFATKSGSARIPRACSASTAPGPLMWPSSSSAWLTIGSRSANPSGARCSTGSVSSSKAFASATGRSNASSAS